MNDSFLNEIIVLPRMLGIGGLAPDIPLGPIRSVWGSTLKLMDGEVFDRVFMGGGGVPGYALADLGTGPDGLRRLRWLLVGHGAVEAETILCATWIQAGRTGAGVRGNYRPFHILSHPVIGPDGVQAHSGLPWRLGSVRWPLPSSPENAPCRLTFPDGVVLSKKVNGKKINVPPVWEEIIRVTHNRLRSLLPRAFHGALDTAVAEWVWDTRERPLIDKTTGGAHLGFSRRQANASGEGRKVYFPKYGALLFPKGLGVGWKLLLAASWLGLGDHYTEGFGWFEVGDSPTVAAARDYSYPPPPARA